MDVVIVFTYYFVLSCPQINQFSRTKFLLTYVYDTFSGRFLEIFPLKNSSSIKPNFETEPDEFIIELTKILNMSFSETLRWKLEI